MLSIFFLSELIFTLSWRIQSAHDEKKSCKLSFKSLKGSWDTPSISHTSISQDCQWYTPCQAALTAWDWCELSSHWCSPKAGEPCQWSRRLKEHFCYAYFKGHASKGLTCSRQAKTEKKINWAWCPALLRVNLLQ